MKQLVFIILWLGVIGCQNVDSPVPPADLIPQEKMVDILTETYLSNAARSFNTRIVREKGYKLDSILYAKFNIDSLQFATSNAYYATDLDTYAGMFEKVAQSLEVLKKEKDSLKFEYTERIRVRDSLKRDSIAQGLREAELLNQDEDEDENEVEDENKTPTLLEAVDTLSNAKPLLGTPLRRNSND